MVRVGVRVRVRVRRVRVRVSRPPLLAWPPQAWQPVLHRS